jgi:hypothetical protein
MKRKVKKYADGWIVLVIQCSLVTSHRAMMNLRKIVNLADMVAYMPKVKNMSIDEVKTGIGKLLGGKSSAAEDRPTSSGVDDYETMGKRAGATSPFSGPKEYISESIKEDTETESPRRHSFWL